MPSRWISLEVREHRLQVGARNLMIELAPPGLQVHVDGVDQPDHQFQQLRRHVAVADEDVLQPQADRLAGGVQRVLGEDRRLGVGVRDRRAAVPERRPCDVGRSRRAAGDLAHRCACVSRGNWEISQFWQKAQRKLHPAVAMEYERLPGRK